MSALRTVTLTEFGRPITELGVVRSITIDDAGVAVALRLPNEDAYLVAADVRDALDDPDVMAALGEIRVRVVDHRDSDEINIGLASGTGCFEMSETSDEVRLTFLRKAHAAALDRCVAAVVRRDGLDSAAARRLLLRDLPSGPHKRALLRRRFALGLSTCPNSRVVVEDGIATRSTHVRTTTGFAELSS